MKVIGNPKAISKISKRTWARAKKLAELANISPTAARSFLSQSTDDQKALLDGTDLRNKALRTLVDAAGEFGKDPTKRYLTDGVPPSHQSSCGGAFLSDTVKVRKINKKTWQAEASDLCVIPAATANVKLLYILKDLADKYGDEAIDEALAALRWLRK